MPANGRKLRVTFSDGEIIIGTTQGYHPDRPGFLLVPADTDTNHERCFIVSGSIKKVDFL